MTDYNFDRTANWVKVHSRSNTLPRFVSPSKPPSTFEADVKENDVKRLVGAGYGYNHAGSKGGSGPVHGQYTNAQAGPSGLRGDPSQTGVGSHTHTHQEQTSGQRSVQFTHHKRLPPPPPSSRYVRPTQVASQRAPSQTQAGASSVNTVQSRSRPSQSAQQPARGTAPSTRGAFATVPPVHSPASNMSHNRSQSQQVFNRLPPPHRADSKTFYQFPYWGAMGSQAALTSADAERGRAPRGQRPTHAHDHQQQAGGHRPVQLSYRPPLTSNHNHPDIHAPAPAQVPITSVPSIPASGVPSNPSVQLSEGGHIVSSGSRLLESRSIRHPGTSTAPSVATSDEDRKENVPEGERDARGEAQAYRVPPVPKSALPSQKIEARPSDTNNQKRFFLPFPRQRSRSREPAPPDKFLFNYLPSYDQSTKTKAKPDGSHDGVKARPGKREEEAQKDKTKSKEKGNWGFTVKWRKSSSADQGQPAAVQWVSQHQVQPQVQLQRSNGTRKRAASTSALGPSPGVRGMRDGTTTATSTWYFVNFPKGKDVELPPRPHHAALVKKRRPPPNAMQSRTSSMQFHPHQPPGASRPPSRQSHVSGRPSSQQSQTGSQASRKRSDSFSKYKPMIEKLFKDERAGQRRKLVRRHSANR